jgi:chromosome segregation ATPase
LLEAEERFNSEISETNKLEATVLQLKNKIEARSEELEETIKGRKLEKDVLLSWIAAAEKHTVEINKSSQMAQKAFNAEKQKLLSRLAELQTNVELMVNEKGSLTETNRELNTGAESLKAHLNEYNENWLQ